MEATLGTYHICFKAVEARLLYTKLICRVIHHGCLNDTVSARARICRGLWCYQRPSYVEFRSMPAREREQSPDTGISMDKSSASGSISSFGTLSAC
jgi:hypothetical protein